MGRWEARPCAHPDPDLGPTSKCTLDRVSQRSEAQARVKAGCEGSACGFRCVVRGGGRTTARGSDVGCRVPGGYFMMPAGQQERKRPRLTAPAKSQSFVPNVLLGTLCVRVARKEGLRNLAYSSFAILNFVTSLTFVTDVTTKHGRSLKKSRNNFLRVVFDEESHGDTPRSPFCWR